MGTPCLKTWASSDRAPQSRLPTMLFCLLLALVPASSAQLPYLDLKFFLNSTDCGPLPSRFQDHFESRVLLDSCIQSCCGPNVPSPVIPARSSIITCSGTNCKQAMYNNAECMGDPQASDIILADGACHPLPAPHLALVAAPQLPAEAAAADSSMYVATFSSDPVSGLTKPVLEQFSPNANCTGKPQTIVGSFCIAAAEGGYERLHCHGTGAGSALQYCHYFDAACSQGAGDCDAVPGSPSGRCFSNRPGHSDPATEMYVC